MTRLLYLLVFLFLSICCQAQDTLYTIDGRQIDCKIRSVDSRSVYLEKPIYPGKWGHIVRKRSVEKIKYASGSVTIINKRKTVNPAAAMPNIISLAPINVNHYGSGYGVAFEGSISRNGIVTLFFPMNLTVNQELVPFKTSSAYNIFQLAPGVKFYPNGNKGKVRYAVGPQLSIDVGEYYRQSSSSGGFIYTEKVSLVNVGFMANNSVNVFLGKYLYLGAEVAIGISLETPLLQSNIRIGYHFR